jgi:predicted peptidase
MTTRRQMVLACVCLLVWSAANAKAEDSPKKGFSNCVFKGAGGSEAKYVLFVPHDYKGDNEYPLILFLHGSGETGTDGEKQAIVGLGPAIREQEQTFPFIAVFPQSQKRNWGANSEDGKRALAILDEVESKYKVDKRRVYLTGLSMGGFGTWSMAAAFPERWAAIAPICGGGNPESAEKIKNIPCWCFHGDKDAAVPVKRSRDMIAALKVAGGKPKYTEYPGVNHNSWDTAYGTKELYPWLLEQHLK